MLSHFDAKLGHSRESTHVDELAAENLTLRTENERLRKELSRVEQDRDLQHAYAKGLQAQLDRERRKVKAFLEPG
jgi:regulator of replication initiation timing